MGAADLIMSWGVFPAKTKFSGLLSDVGEL